MFFNSLCEEYPFHAHSKFSAICKRKPPNYFGKLMKEIYAGMQTGPLHFPGRFRRARPSIKIINNYWMRLSGISRIIEVEVGVICRSRRLRQITLTEASIILDTPRKPNSIIILLFTWTVLSFTWTILLFTWADTKIMI